MSVVPTAASVGRDLWGRAEEERLERLRGAHAAKEAARRRRQRRGARNLLQAARTRIGRYMARAAT